MKFNYRWTLADANFTKDKGKVFSCFACGGGSTMGYKLAGFDVPYDWDDFSRCYDLVKYGEVTKDELQKVVEAFPFYKPIIDRWDDLIDAYLSPGGKGVYRILDSVYGEVMRLKGYVNLGGGCYSKKL